MCKRFGMGLHAADVGGLEIGVEGYGFLPVMAGLVEVVGGVERVAKALVGSGLLVLVTDVTR